jgi:pimeloyl-ACP methyl ester carboxylesterase
MTAHIVHLQQRQTRPGRVIALHSSGVGAGQWSYLEKRLGSGWEVLAPEHYGSESAGPWTGAHAFRLADEGVHAIRVIDGCSEKVHLVGHGYGGAVALSVALSRPDRIASLALYEPSAFHLLRAMGEAGTAALAEVDTIARKTREGVATGDYAGAAAALIDYCSGPGAWTRLQPWVQAAFMRWASKAPLEFRALVDEPTPLVAYAGLSMPILVMRGDYASRPARMVAELLCTVLPRARLVLVGGAGHMGPITHAAVVNDLIATHVSARNPALLQSRSRTRGGAVPVTPGGPPASDREAS